jgi:hypothetical protein
VGKFGSGKTAISWYMGKLFLEAGHFQTMVTNFPAIGGTYPPPRPLSNSVIVLDEAGTYIRSGADADLYYAALRKQGNIILTPSVVPPPRQMSLLSARRIMNLYTLGLPMWVYRWKLEDPHYPQQGWFSWWRPISDFAGGYDTDYFPTDDWGIQEALMDTVMKGRKMKAQRSAQDYR